MAPEAVKQGQWRPQAVHVWNGGEGGEGFQGNIGVQTVRNILSLLYFTKGAVVACPGNEQVRSPASATWS